MGTAVVERTAVEIVEELYARHERMVYARCLATLRSRTDAEDAVQTTFLQAFRAISRGVVPESEAAWLCTIADNVSRSSLRASFRRTRRIEAAEHAGHVACNHEDSHGATEDVRALRAALQELPERQQRVMLLREWRGLSSREIAVELGISKSAADMLQHRARRTLARALQRARAALDALGIAAAGRTLLGGGASSPVAAAVVSAALIATLPLVATGSAARALAPAAATPAAARASTPAPLQGSGESQSAARQAVVAPVAPSLRARSGAWGAPASRAAPQQTLFAPAAPSAPAPVAQGDPTMPAGSEPSSGNPPLAPSMPSAGPVSPPVAPVRDPVVTVVEEVAGPVPAVPALPLPAVPAVPLPPVAVPPVAVPSAPVSPVPVPEVPVLAAPVQPPSLPQPTVPTVPPP